MFVAGSPVYRGPRLPRRAPRVPQGFNPPYSTPSAGSAAWIAQNSYQDVRPSWFAAGNWQWALWNSYGLGAYNAEATQGGEYTLLGTGGHGHPSTIDACVFDFTDATWKFLLNGNGVTDRDQTGVENPYVEGTHTSGSPFYEINGSSVPAPTHTYANQCPLPSNMGGGSKGSILMVGRGALGQGASPSTAIHRWDRSTRVWSRWTNNTLSAMGPDATVVFDKPSSRYWVFQYQRHSFEYTERVNSDGTITQVSHSFPPSLGTSPCATIAPERGLIFHQGASAVRVQDVANMAAGYQSITTTGIALPTASWCYWEWHPVRGAFYKLPATGGTTLYKLTPPATNPFSNAWTVSSETLGGDAPPTYFGTGVGVDPYRSLVYIDALGMFAWFSGHGDLASASRQVTLINPAA